MHSIERKRRSRLALLREILASEGYDGTVRLVDGPGGIEIALSPEPGLTDDRLRDLMPGGVDGADDDMLAVARNLVDRAGIAQRRANAIIQGGGILTDPPTWAFLGNPLARAAYAAMGMDLSDLRTSIASTPAGKKLGMRIVEFRIVTANLRLARDSITISMDADNDAARVRILGGHWPETVVQSLAGRPIGDIIELPGAERGTPTGDAPILRTWAETNGIGMTIRCAAEPMGEAPEGVDLGFLKEWVLRHYR